jgi:colanic acid biosynthesis glycosyl transferase WcaI
MGVPRILVVKDVMPDAAVELGMLRNRFVIAISKQLARWAYALAHEIHTLGEGMRRRIAAEARRDVRIRIVPDTIDGNELRPMPFADNEFRKRYAPADTFAVVHTGNMGKKQDLDLLLRAARLLQDDPVVRFYVFGDGAEKARFLERREALGLENVSHYPLQERWMLPHTLSGADVLLVSQLPEVLDIVVPSKLLSAMASGALIVAACAANSEAARLVRESGGGILVDAGNEAALVETIREIRAGKHDVLTLRERARRFAIQRFDRAAVYGDIIRWLVHDAGVLGETSSRVPTDPPRLERFAEKGAK